MSDTIAALATPRGEGAIAIVRLSGPAAQDIAARLFRRKNRTRPIRSGQLTYGHIVRPEDGTVIDEVLVVCLRATATYTREDMAEIHCHGGWLAARLVLELVLAGGARLAQPGEFTRRAFLNGRIDLTQAAAVAAVVRAQSEAGLTSATRQLAGACTAELAGLVERLTGLAAKAEAALNFPDDVAYQFDAVAWRNEVRALATDLDRLAERARQGAALRDGVRVAIVGAPNAGKSTLFNALLKQERAIVSDLPGTTRDAIEEHAIIDGQLYLLADTAGLAPAGSALEAAMTAKTHEYLAQAEIVVLVADSSVPAPPLPTLPERMPGQGLVVAANKLDQARPQALEAITRRYGRAPLVRVSALTGAGLPALREALGKLAGSAPGPDAVHLSIQQGESLRAAHAELAALAVAIDGKAPAELWAEHTRQALARLEEFTGRHLDADMLDRIFAQFCIGK